MAGNVWLQETFCVGNVDKETFSKKKFVGAPLNISSMSSTHFTPFLAERICNFHNKK